MSEMIEPPTRIPFGPFEADLPSQELRKHGVHLRLPRQSFQILKMLLERPGEVVTREELRAKLWTADTFVDFDHGLNAAVKRLRDALDDSAEHPRFIETLPKLGYRFIAGTVAHASPPQAPAPRAPAPEEVRPPLKKWNWSWLIGAAAALLIMCALFAMDVGGVRQRLLHRSAAQPQVHSIAVLPLANLSSDPQQEYFADAMTDELIGELSRLGALKVVSRTSVMQYKAEKRKSLSQIGREFNVDAVLEGSVLRSGNRVRIAAHMIYAPTDQNLMVETYEGDLRDVLKLQREVAESIAQQVCSKLTPEQHAWLRQGREVNPEAFDAYLMANSLDWSRYQETKNAQGYVEKAIQKDPGFAEAYADLAWTHIRFAEFRWLSPQYVYAPAKQAAHRALELDATNCRAHLALG